MTVLLVCTVGTCGEGECEGRVQQDLREGKFSGLHGSKYAVLAMSTIPNGANAVQYFLKLTMLTDKKKGTRNGRQGWEERQTQEPETEGKETGTPGESEAGEATAKDSVTGAASLEELFMYRGTHPML